MTRARVVWGQQKSSGRRTSWARTVHGLREGKGARALEGEYLRDGEENHLAVGTLVVEVRYQGGVMDGWQEARILRVAADGCLEVIQDNYDWRREWLSLRTRLRELLGTADRLTSESPRARIARDLRALADRLDEGACPHAIASQAEVQAAALRIAYARAVRR